MQISWRDMDAVLWQEQQQEYEYMQLLFKSQAEERKRSLLSPVEVKETRRLQRDFQDEFLSVLGQFAQSLSPRLLLLSHTELPLDQRLLPLAFVIMCILHILALYICIFHIHIFAD